MSVTIRRSYKYVDYNVSAPNNRGYLTIDTSSWIDYPWMFYELPSLKFEIYTESGGELLKYKNFTREIRTYNPVYSPLGVLNVTIDIRNVPEEFILRITPIFDNDAIAARNMLIENGIENGEIWGSDQDVPTQLFNLDLEFIECEGEYVPPTPPVPPTHEETITGVPPITFDGSTGEPLVSWTILGNGQQTGTPSPDNIIMPEFVGARTAQIIDYTLSESGGIDNSGNLVIAQNLWRSTVFYDIHDGISLSFEKYSELAAIRVNYYDADYLHISRQEFSVAVSSGVSLTIPANAKYFKWTMLVSSGTTINIDFVRQCYIMFNDGTEALHYEPFGYKIPITCAEQTVPVYLGQVQTLRRVGKLVLNGTESWSNVGGQAPFQYLPSNFAMLSQDVTFYICSHYKAISYNDSWTSNDKFVSASVQGLRFKDSSFQQNIDDFKAFLAAQYAAGTPVTVWYVLAEPTTGIVNEPLAKIGEYADELSSTDAEVTIPTSEGQNNLTVDTDLQPSEMTITYIKEGQ